AAVHGTAVSAGDFFATANDQSASGPGTIPASDAPHRSSAHGDRRDLHELLALLPSRWLGTTVTQPLRDVGPIEAARTSRSVHTAWSIKAAHGHQVGDRTSHAFSRCKGKIAIEERGTAGLVS